MTKKIKIVTLGCAKNDNDTDNLARLLKSKGHSVAENPEDADAIVVHTCSFIEAAKKESVEAILNAAKQKKDGAQLIVTGCMVQQHGKEMMAELPEADAFLGTGQLARVDELLNSPRERFLDRTNPGGLTDPDAPGIIEYKGPTATIRLSEGCSHPCSFCVIPKLRGGLQSRPEEKILNEAKMLAQAGIQELMIIGQDTGDWGRDLYKERRLPKLLRQMRQIPGLKWIRLMYMHPQSFSNELLDVFSESPEIFPYLDMPLQHIDDGMLRDMNRIVPEKDLRNLVERIRTRVPKLSLRTTFIVGYPGETEAQFENLRKYVSEGHFDYLGSFTYSKEESTPAAIKTDQIEDDVKEERQSLLTEAYYESCLRISGKRINTTEEILIEDQEGDTYLGRSQREAPEIDAIIRAEGRAFEIGKFYPVRITGYDAFEFSARPVNAPIKLIPA